MQVPCSGIRILARIECIQRYGDYADGPINSYVAIVFKLPFVNKS
jgi:hypothetical protein